MFPKDKSEEEDYEDEKVISSDEMKFQLENLRLTVRKSCKTYDNCMFLNKLAILRKFNDYYLGTSNPFASIGSTSTSGSTSASVFSSTCWNYLSHLENENCSIQTDKTALLHRNLEIDGEFQLTDYRILFLPKMEFCMKEFILPQYFSVPLSLILTVMKKKDSSLKNKYTIKLTFRDRPGFSIGFSEKTDYMNVFEKLSAIVSQKSICNYFAFKYFVKYENLDNIKENGWISYQHLLEYMRMGVNLNDEKCKYKLYIQEIEGEICPTYPNYIYIPQGISSNDLMDVAKFRAKGRFPALSWFSSLNNASLWRASQAKTGMIDNRNEAEEMMLEILSHETEKLHIYDARPYISALANKMKGLGFENIYNYKNCQLMFCDIENIHGVKNAFNQVTVICQLPLEGYSDWYLNIHNTKWLIILSKIIKASVDIAASLLENATVLIHCSDGWDRTSQLTSLTQLIIDPFYRTLKGFEVLIEKEWISFGHQFAERCGHSIPRNEEATSPIFVQFLDCVYQFLNQFPDMFEFNNDLLYFLSYHVYSCLYGTFLLNNEKEQLSMFLKFKTVSIWTDVNMNSGRFINKEYNSEKSKGAILTPSCALYKLKLWEEFFLRWNPYYVMNNFEKLPHPYV